MLPIDGKVFVIPQNFSSHHSIVVVGVWQPEHAPVEVEQLQHHGHHGVDEDDDLEGHDPVQGEVGGGQGVANEQRALLVERHAGVQGIVFPRGENAFTE